MADRNQTEEQRRYNSNVADLADEQADDISDTAAKIPAAKSEQRVTTSTEGGVERTTERKSSSEK